MVLLGVVRCHPGGSFQMIPAEGAEAGEAAEEEREVDVGKAAG
jgi:hypothetical protein